jgi:perosamine synthetase
MIPRHQPAYAWRQWQTARNDRRMRAELERELGARLCKMMGRRHAVFYARGRDAIFAWCEAQPGRTVYVPAFTCCVVPEALLNAGAKLEFVDVDLATLNTEIEQLKGVHLPGGSFFMLTHQWGNPCRAREILEWAKAHKLRVIEDCAAALGASIEGKPCGSFGEVAFISFENTKMLGSGQLGALLTDDDDLSEKLRAAQAGWPVMQKIGRRTALLKLINQNWIYRPVLKAFTWRTGDYFGDHGEQQRLPAAAYQQRADPFALALALAQWPDLEQRRRHREMLREIYQHELESMGPVATFSVNPGARPCLIRMPLRVRDKRMIYRKVLRSGIDLGWSFDYTVSSPTESENFPNASVIARSVLNLPIHEGVSGPQALRIGQMAREFLKA